MSAARQCVLTWKDDRKVWLIMSCRGRTRTLYAAVMMRGSNPGPAALAKERYYRKSIINILVGGILV